ncbi:CLUMA_CG020896, isoform A [Clunio marinus]|uniref:CLUMA_CG020896, isoform A n=1 Tax=Clunio marinus TaxID=568069 RepID=A0A1J1J7J1_9DIPT|nr:CLUMA_CG020896, isoform A [Clunio marinus]
MSLRNFVPSYPQLSVNGPPPPHHRVQALPVSVQALQQQISQQQAAQQQSQAPTVSNQNGGGGNVQSAPSHEYHLAPCLPFQTPAGANITQNFIRHMSNGGYAQAHQNQTIYQTQSGPPNVVQSQQQSQSNPAQSLPNAVQQNQARLTPMTQPTAPSTPPTQQQQQQQQQQQSQQAPQYPMQIQQQVLSGANNAGNSRTPQYRPQSQAPRRQQQQPMNQQQYMYPPQIPFGFVLPHPTTVRPQYGYMGFTPVFNSYTTPGPNAYGQLNAPTNGQQRQSTPQAAAPSMAPPQTNEYPYQSMEVYPPVMQAAAVPTQVPQPSQPPQKTAKKMGNRAVPIINPNTKKSIFEDDSWTTSTNSGSGNSTGTSTGGSNNGSSSSSIATVDKAITASHNELSKDEALDKDSTALTSTTTSEPSTPVVSAMSDGPSVDITPKHQVNKMKKIKPPEPTLASVVASTESVKQTKINENETLSAVTPVTAPIPKQDNNNINNNNAHPDKAENVVEEMSQSKPAVQQQSVVAEATTSTSTTTTTPQDSNNNNNNNNNSIDDKSIMTSPSLRHVTTAPGDLSKQGDEMPKLAETFRKISVIEGPINYVDGQWSPLNTAGKKCYTREQLLKLKDQLISATPPSLTKLPENVAHTLMKDNKNLLTNTLNMTLAGMGGGVGGSGGASSMQRSGFDPINSLTPKFVNSIGGRNPYTKRPSQQGNKQVQGGNRGSQAGIIKLQLSLHDDVKLNEAENAWKPSHLVTSRQDMTEEERMTSELLNRFRSMLNKLTAENFDTLVNQVKKTYKIDTSERLDGVISLVFEKAISEPKFAPTYAELCKKVADIATAPSALGEGTKKPTLKVKLITQCQKEFERHKEESIVFDSIEEKLREIENLPANENRDEEKARLEEEHYKVRQRANGTVKFIGELFKIDMLTSKIMHACIDMLLQDPTEEKIERVCKLLTTIGRKIEEKERGEALDKYFNTLKDILNSPLKVIKSSRIKFEIQNLNDLRNNGWQSRRQDLIPKTLEQIQQDTEKEQQMINYQTRQNAKEDRQRGGGGSSGGNQINNYNRRQQQQQDNEGWQLQQNKSRQTPLQMNKFSIPSINNQDPKLGSPTNYQQFQAPNSNKFAMLPVDMDVDMPGSNIRFGGGGGSKNSSMERGGDRGNNRMYGNGGAPPYSGRSSGSNQGSRNSSQIRSRDNSDSRGGPSRSLQAPPRQQQIPHGGIGGSGGSTSFSGALKQHQQKPTMINASSSTSSSISSPAALLSLTRDEVEKNFNDMLKIVDAFRDDKLTTETAMDKLKSLSVNKDVLIEIYNKFLDRKDRDRENLMMLIVEMLKQKKLTREDNRLALIGTMAIAPDMQYDVPLVYEYIAQFLAELLIASVITFQDVYQICEADIKTKGEDMLRFIFTFINKRHGESRLQKIYSDKNFELEKFLDDGNLNRFLEANKFSHIFRRGAVSLYDVITHVKKMLNEKEANNEEIMNYINSSQCFSDSKFIHNLTTAVIEHCYEFNSSSSQPSSKINTTRLEELSLLLQRYINNEAQLELECINALNSYAYEKEYPLGLLNSFFEILYDNDVLSVEAFEKWKNQVDHPGKGVAVFSTRQFFTKLAEDKDDDDGDLMNDDADAL